MYKIPESVLVVVHTPGLDVLLIRRADSVEPFWQSVTGSKDALHEPYAATAAREVREETGIDPHAPGCVLRDDPKNNVYPLARDAEGTNDVYVGRIRRDDSAENALNLWCVADNIRKGAAANAVQIAFSLIDQGIL